MGASSLKKWGTARTVMGCVIFNLVSEFWVHGLTGFMNPVLTGSLIVLYTTYFLMLEDLVGKYRLRDYHVLIVGAIFGLWHETFTTGSVFDPGNPTGVNPVVVFISTIFWWGILQSVIGLYFANRFFGVRDWDHKRLGRVGWGLCLVFSLQAAQTTLRMNGSTVNGYVTSLSLLAIAALTLIRIEKPEIAKTFQKSSFLDAIVAVHITSSLFIGLFYGSIQNPTTTIAFVAWSIVFGVLVVLHRLTSRKNIPV